MHQFQMKKKKIRITRKQSIERKRKKRKKNKKNK